MLAAGDARVSVEVLAGGDLLKTGLLEQFLHGGLLIIAMLDQQPASCVQALWCTGNDGAQRIETIWARNQRQLGFMHDIPLFEVGIVFGNVGRIAHNQIETADFGVLCKRFIPRAFKKAHTTVIAIFFCVSIGDIQDIQGLVGGNDLCVG